MDRLLKDGSSDIAGGGGAGIFVKKKLFLMKLKNVVIEV